MPVAVRELELDLDAFEGPFDLLLSLVLRDELPLREVDLAEIVIAFVEHLAERGELDLDACGEFLVLISALLELKARALFPDEDAELAELEPEEAAEELARRLAEYRRAKEAAGWLASGSTSAATASSASARRRSRRTAGARARAAGAGEARRGAAAARGRAARAVDRAHGAALPAGRAVPRALALAAAPPLAASTSTRRSPGLSRVEVAVAFLALLELRKQGEIAIAQAAPFAPIRISRADVERSLSWNVRSA